ncbi:MAG: LacI family DNA-binding transcriptional regulator [Granulosicoccus sp.]|nr:LacI family DNA-binding transcriptional regulator [Granulosicoccus sp.]
MAKLSDIANEVGVSNKTVSMTLRGIKCTSEETSKRIFEVTARIGYVPNQAARDMRLQESHFIGLLADMVATTPHTVELIRGAQAEAIENKRNLLVGTLDNDPDAPKEFMRMFQSHRAAGVIYATLYRRRLEQKLGNSALKVVMANCAATDHSAISVLPDDYGGGYLQGEKVLAMGHERIGVISLSNTAPATAHRMKGIRTALEDKGSTLNEALVREGIEGTPPSEQYVAYEVALDMLSQDNRPTAIICGNDRIAMLVYSAAARLKLMIPEDLSVVGFDNFTTISEGLRPALTTIELPYFEMGRRAVRAVLNKDATNADEETVPCTMIERDSCAPPRSLS